MQMNKGYKVVGSYVLVKRIGQGAFATVWRGNNKQTGDEVAIKVISRDRLNKKLQENLESEISILKRMHHPNIVALHDIQKTERHIYLVLEYCSGGDLSRFIKKHGPLPEDTSQNLLGQLTSGLHFLRQQNLIHRDLKPQNLLLSGPEGKCLKIADFGFARYIQPQGLAETLCGSPLYMAPEILKFQKYDAKADLWSVGAILFEMVCGKPPFSGANHVQLLQNIERHEVRIPEAITLSDGCIDLLKNLLKRNPMERLTFKNFFTHPFVASAAPRLSRLGSSSSNVGSSTSRHASISSSPSTHDNPSGSPAGTSTQHLHHSPSPTRGTSVAASAAAIPSPVKPVIELKQVTAPFPLDIGTKSPTIEAVNNNSNEKEKIRVSPHATQRVSIPASGGVGNGGDTQDYSTPPPQQLQQDYHDPQAGVIQSPNFEGTPNRLLSKAKQPKLNPFKDCLWSDAAARHFGNQTPRPTFVKIEENSESLAGSLDEYVMVNPEESHSDIREPSVKVPQNDPSNPSASTMLIQQWKEAATTSHDNDIIVHIDGMLLKSKALGELGDLKLQDGRVSEGLALYVQTMEFLIKCIDNTKKLVDDNPGVDWVESVCKQALGTMREKFANYLKKSETCTQKQHVNNVGVSADQLVYESALQLARISAVEEAMGNFQKSIATYRWALCLLEYLYDANADAGEDDKAILMDYIHKFKIRISEIVNHKSSQPTQMAVAAV